MFDPRKPFIGTDGLEYENLGERLQGRPRDCPRNDHIRRFCRHEDGTPDWEAVFAIYEAISPYGHLYAASGPAPAVPQYHPRHRTCPASARPAA